MAATPVFVNGIPARIDRVFFRTRYGQNFPDLLPTTMNAFLDTLIEDTYTMFTGVERLWDRQPDDVYFYKTQLCYSHLLAWYIADLFPTYTAGIPMIGGVPIKSKSIGGVKISFGSDERDGMGKVAGYKDALSTLKSNPFGCKAYQMIQGSPQKYVVRGRRPYA